MDGKDLEIWMIVNLTNIFAKYAQRTASWAHSISGHHQHNF